MEQEVEVICDNIKVVRPHVELNGVEEIRSGERLVVLKRPFNTVANEGDVTVQGGKVVVRGESAEFIWVF